MIFCSVFHKNMNLFALDVLNKIFNLSKTNIIKNNTIPYLQLVQLYIYNYMLMF